MKREQRQRYAPLALALALVGLAVAFGGYIVYRAFAPVVTVSLTWTVLLLALYVFLVPEKVQSALTGRQARYGSNALILSLAFIGILAVINYVGYQLYSDEGRKNVWGNTKEKDTVDSKIADGTAQPYSVYGRVSKLTTGVATGEYTDAVTVTVSF